MWDRVGPLKEKESDLSSLAAAQSVFHCTAPKRLVEQHPEHLRDYERIEMLTGGDGGKVCKGLFIFKSCE